MLTYLLLRIPCSLPKKPSTSFEIVNLRCSLCLFASVKDTVVHRLHFSVKCLLGIYSEFSNTYYPHSSKKILKMF